MSTKEPKRPYEMYDGTVMLTRTERMEKNYMPGEDRAPNSFSGGYSPCKVFEQSIEERDAKMKVLIAWMKKVSK